MCKHCGLPTHARFAKNWCKCQELVTDGYCTQRPLNLVIHPSRPLRGSDPPRGGYVASSREPPRLGPRRARRGRPSRRLPRVWTARPPRRGGRGRRRAPAGARRARAPRPRPVVAGAVGPPVAARPPHREPRIDQTLQRRDRPGQNGGGSEQRPQVVKVLHGDGEGAEGGEAASAATSSGVVATRPRQTRLRPRW